MGKLADMLEGVKRECEAITLDASMWKDQRDEMEAKSQSTQPNTSSHTHLVDRPELTHTYTSIAPFPTSLFLIVPRTRVFALQSSSRSRSRR